jgi:hypothetical protein
VSSVSGHVFHPGHEELHGVTVVVEARGLLTYIGRYDRKDDRGIHLLDVGEHGPESGLSREEYIARSLKFGVRVVQRYLTIPADQVARISPLGSWAPPQPR